MILSCNVIKYNASNTESLECEFISRLSTKLDLKTKKTHIFFFNQTGTYKYWRLWTTDQWFQYSQLQTDEFMIVLRKVINIASSLFIKLFQNEDEIEHLMFLLLWKISSNLSFYEICFKGFSSFEKEDNKWKEVESKTNLGVWHKIIIKNSVN